MSLVKCGDCGGKVSTAAAACPHCGRPANTSPPHVQQPIRVEPRRSVGTHRTGGQYEAVGCLMIVIGMVIAMLGAAAESAVSAPIGGILLFAGFVIFMIGRFM